MLRLKGQLAYHSGQPISFNLLGTACQIYTTKELYENKYEI